MKQKIPKVVTDDWKEKKELEEKLEYETRKKIYDVYITQIKNGYPSPIKRGLFRSYYLCPVCGTELDILLNDVGVLTICSECEYEYLDTRIYGLETLLRISKEFNKKGKKY